MSPSGRRRSPSLRCWLGLLVQVAWMVRLQPPANQLSVLVLIAPIPLLCWWSYLAGLRVRPESLRRVLLPAAVSVVAAFVTAGFWSASVWKTINLMLLVPLAAAGMLDDGRAALVLTVGVLLVGSEVVRRATCAEFDAADQLGRELLAR